MGPSSLGIATSAAGELSKQTQVGFPPPALFFFHFHLSYFSDRGTSQCWSCSFAFAQFRSQSPSTTGNQNEEEPANEVVNVLDGRTQTLALRYVNLGRGHSQCEYVRRPSIQMASPALQMQCLCRNFPYSAMSTGGSFSFRTVSVFGAFTG